MAPIKHFRTAFSGFNREDVVAYIEYLNNHHNAQVEQLNNQLQVALSKNAAAEELQAKLDAALARCKELEDQLQQTPAPAAVPADTELEAYRRAEQAERLARERAQQIRDQANAVLADVTVKVEEASARIDAQLQSYQTCMEDSRAILQDAAAALSAIQ